MKMTFDFKDFRNYKPKKSKKYMTITYNGNIIELPYSVEHNSFNVHDNDTDTDTAIEVKMWAEINYPKSIRLELLKDKLEYKSMADLTDLIYDIGDLTNTDERIIDEIVGKLDNIYNDF